MPHKKEKNEEKRTKKYSLEGWMLLPKLEGPSKRPKKKLKCIFYFKNGFFNFHSLQYNPLSGSGFREMPCMVLFRMH